MKYPLFLLFLVFQFNFSSFEGGQVVHHPNSRLSKFTRIFKLKKKKTEEPFKYAELSQSDRAAVGTINHAKLKRCRRIDMTVPLNNYRNEKC